MHERREGSFRIVRERIEIAEDEERSLPRVAHGHSHYLRLPVVVVVAVAVSICPELRRGNVIAVVVIARRGKSRTSSGA